MKRLFSLFLLLSLLAGAFGGWVWWQNVQKAPSENTTSQPFIIKQGEGASSIGMALEKEGFVRSSVAFRLYVQLTNKSTSIRAGDYRISKNLSLIELVSELTLGPVAVWVTIQEGLRREEVGQKVASGLELTETERDSFIQEFAKATFGEEGFLFPDTYLFNKTASASAVARRLISTFDNK